MRLANYYLLTFPMQRTLTVRVDRDEKHRLVNSQHTSWQFKVEKIFLNISQKEIYNVVGRELIDAGVSGIQGEGQPHEESAWKVAMPIQNSATLRSSRGHLLSIL